MRLRLRHFLESKGRGIWAVGPQDTVFRALEIMAEKDVGAVVVVDGTGAVIGMFTERDYARQVILKGRSSPKTRVGEVMRPDPEHVSIDDPPDRCMEIMAALNIRHLPVMDGTKLAGVISMGDLLRACITDRENDIAQLTGYIKGTA